MVLKKSRHSYMALTMQILYVLVQEFTTSIFAILRPTGNTKQTYTLEASSLLDSESRLRVRHDARVHAASGADRISRERGRHQRGQSAAGQHRAAPTTVSPAALPPDVGQTRRVDVARVPALALPEGLRALRLLDPAAPGAANRHAPAPRRREGFPPRRGGENCPAIAAHSGPEP